MCIADKFSNWASVRSGVPQGSVVGPILFCMATDTLSPVCSNSVMVKYADDVSILHFLRKSDDDRLIVSNREILLRAERFDLIIMTNAVS